MAGTFVQSKGGQTTSGSSCGISLTSVGANNHLACCGIYNGTITLNLATSTPSATWQNASPQVQGTNAAVRLDYSENVASGSWTVTANSTTTTGMTAVAIESSGVATSASKGAVSAGGTSAASTVQPGSITPTAGSILIGVVADSGIGSAIDTADAGGQTGNFTVTPAGGAGTCWDSGANRGGAFYHNNVSAVATNPTITSPATSIAGQACVMAEFKAATASGTTGTIASTLAGLTIAATATETFTGTVAVTLAGLTEALTAVETFTGTIAETLVPFTVAATAVETFTSTVASTLAGLTVSATAVERFTGTTAVTLAGLSIAATGTSSGTPPNTTGTIAVRLAGLSLSLAVTVYHQQYPPCFGLHAIGATHCLLTHALIAPPVLTTATLTPPPNLGF